MAIFFAFPGTPMAIFRVPGIGRRTGEIEPCIHGQNIHDVDYQAARMRLFRHKVFRRTRLRSL